MNKTDLISKLAESGLKKADAELAVNSLVNIVTDALANGDKLQLVGFGTFSVKERPARVARNLQTGKEIKVPASKAPVFKAGKALKDAVNK
ncbi:MAG: HU family DNA-binding protein [Bacteroidales bacterium]|nr:HU family DNA-binding protein [Clostridia bacterium]MBR3653761.1 HU family DNA-binding protein [Bacteroidales bacterium]MBR4457653.1 HU family DNA-binding protein [Clostridia bacterium]